MRYEAPKTTKEAATFLKKEKGGFLFSTIKWNFTKFLVDQQGVVVKRYAPTVKPATIEADIKNLFS